MEKQIMLDDMIKSMERSIKWRENAVAERVKDIYDAVFGEKNTMGKMQRLILIYKICTTRLSLCWLALKIF